ncbi:CMGC/SRPK protein kinase [Polytolypa hystricis UAMH7299]|uniref:non-specific serine/threonine protein kinase n=1 Tax=Polytolypa hystricis (strain UAMH7299) TaxID=1447883 RepID=A0A2B7WY32_POLH7|nr:CMGC/SRPK protein kinase [Polytolypa hystricis UAMH7299]
MASLVRRTLSLAAHLQLNTIRTGGRIQVAFSVQPQMKMPSLWTAITSSWKSFSTKSLGGTTVSNTLEEPRSLPTSGFKTIEADQLVEEEELPDCRADRFYPVQLGEVFQGRYQIVAKLGFDHKHVTLKVYVHTSLVHRELSFFHHIAPRMADSSHQGRGNIRRLLDSFEVTGPHGKHIILVFEAAQMSLRDMKVVFRQDGYDEDFVRGAITEPLKALDFLHTHGEVVHTDVHPGNLLLGIYDNSLLQNLEGKEFTSPVPHKLVSSTRTVYFSRLMRPKEGPMLLSDFGEARIGSGPHGGDIMPLEYRAPETLLYVGWSYPVDIWSVGFTLIAALGPPPPEFLAKNPERKADFWDENGKWLGLAPIPDTRTMEALEIRLEDNNKSEFLRFLRRAVTWMPEERATAIELLQDPWLTGTKA